MLLTAFRTPESPLTLCGATEGVTDLLGFGIPLCDFRKPYSRVYRKDVSRKPLSSDSEKELVPSRLAHQKFLSPEPKLSVFFTRGKGQRSFREKLRVTGLPLFRRSREAFPPRMWRLSLCRRLSDWFCILRRLTENSRHFKSPSFRDSAA